MTCWQLVRPVCGLSFGLSLAACVSVPENPYFNPAKPHHRPDGFVNSSPTALTGADVPWYEILWRSMRGDFRPSAEPEGGYEAFAKKWSVPLDPAALASPKEAPVVTWLGHATILLQVDGLNILTDPQFSDFAGPLPWMGAERRVAPPIAIEDLPPIDLVLISHNHYDHLDEASIDRLVASGKRNGKAPRFIVPLGLKHWFDVRKIAQVEEIDWWDKVALGAATVHLVPGQHWSKRTLWDDNLSLWGGFVVERKRTGWKFYYTGDTGYSGDFVDIRQRLGAMDFLAVPIGAYLPRDFMRPQHTNPVDAVQIALDVEAKQAIGIHWGTFGLTQEPFDQPPRDLAAALKARELPADRFTLLRQGESLPARLY